MVASFPCLAPKSCVVTASATVACVLACGGTCCCGLYDLGVVCLKLWVRYAYGVGQLAFDTVDVALECLQSCCQGCDLLAYGVEDSGVLVALRNLALQGRVLCRKACNLVLLCLVLHLGEFREDGVGVGGCAVTEREGVLVGVVHEGVGLLAVGQLVLVSHRGNGVLRLAAAVGNLRNHAVVAALDGVDDLCAREAYAVLDTVERALYLRCRAVERLCQLADGCLVAVEQACYEFRRSVGRIAASAPETSEAAVVPSEDACHDGEVDYAPDAVLSAEASVAVHHGEHALPSLLKT